MIHEVKTNLGVVRVAPEREIVRRGFGWIVPIGSYAWVFFIAFVTHHVEAVESLQGPANVIGLALLFASLTSAVAHYMLRDRGPRHLIDPKTGLDFVLVREHKYLWLGLTIWAGIQGGLGALVLLINLLGAPA